MSPSLPAFSLRDHQGLERFFPSGRNTVIAFVKEDCATCNLVAPLLDQLRSAPDLEVLIVGRRRMAIRRSSSGTGCGFQSSTTQPQNILRLRNRHRTDPDSGER